MTPSELIRLLARSTADAARRRAADELWATDWLEDAIADPDQQTPPWIGDCDGVAHRITGFDSLNLMPVAVCGESVDVLTVYGWGDPTPPYCCPECGELDDDEATFLEWMRERQNSASSNTG